ncbi:peptide/nickel transport system substrate-binding protein [Nocardioides terrae]|uniref:Peptide/nickel transport system substrate-binding protein n=1 Tax=Nocardioides terrae TaxID=574651 RepID=A0A1I1N8X8_9ACTN|nr:ABC transporter substrate-binding protein [Nocardioides terrae]SFC94111.1 peptide/nickel transport system substrate-binding protein [Nocardioides terrae]
MLKSRHHAPRLTKRLGVALTSASLSVVLLAGCGSDGSSSNGGGAGVLRIGDASSKIDSLNPFVGHNGFATATFRVIYPYLLQYDQSQNIVGDFAKTTAVADGGKTLTFTTHDGAKWSDGKPLTAADAAWTINTFVRLKDGAAATFAPYVTNIVKASAPTPTTLTVEYSTPTATAQDGLASLPILPEHIWEPMAAGRGEQLASFANASPVSAGPFKLTQYTENQFANFATYKGYYGPAPKLKGFGFQFFTSNDAMLSALRSHELDVAYEVPPTAVSQLKDDKSLTVNNVAGLDTDVLGFNSSSFQDEHSELKDLRVRQAIDLAIDKKSLIDVVADGSGMTTGTMVPPALKQWNNPAVAATPFDLASANALLDSMGFARGADGIRTVNGRPMSYKLLFPSVATGAPRVVTEVVKQLAAIGIKVDARSSDFPTFLQAIYGPENHYRNWDMMITDYAFGYDPSGYLFSWTCSQLGGNNLAAYCDRDYDELFARQSTQTGAERVKTVQQAQLRFAHEKPVIPLYVANAISVARSIGNLPEMTSSPLVVVNYMSKTWIEQATIG